MEKVTIQMPKVMKCTINNCGYNHGDRCHAKAITIGDVIHPECDTFLDSQKHTNERNRIACVGACKVIDCVHNEDFECCADYITVKLIDGKNRCQAYLTRP